MLSFVFLFFAFYVVVNQWFYLLSLIAINGLILEYNCQLSIRKDEDVLIFYYSGGSGPITDCSKVILTQIKLSYRYFQGS